MKKPLLKKQNETRKKLNKEQNEETTSLSFFSMVTKKNYLFTVQRTFLPLNDSFRDGVVVVVVVVGEFNNLEFVVVVIVVGMIIIF